MGIENSIYPFTVQAGKNICYSAKKIYPTVSIDFDKLDLPTQGTLQWNESESYLYLKVDDRYIWDLLPKLEISLQAPPYFTSECSMGAHISVIYPEELAENFLLDQKKDLIYHFSPLDFYYIEVFNKQIAVLIVSSTELLQIRHHYGLPEKLNYKGLLVPFHITLGVNKIS
jgi:hypothetical protein